MPNLLKSCRWQSREWDAVEKEAARLGVPPATFVRLFVLAGIAPTGLDDKVKKAQRWFKKANAQPAGSRGE